MLNLQHNIVSVLYTIKGMSESHLIQAEEGRYPNPEARLAHAEKVLQKIGAQVWKALEITKRLGRALKAEQSPKDRKAAVQEAWCAVETILKKEFPKRKIEFINRIPENFPLIQCVPDELQEVLYHLAKNAVQACLASPLRRSFSEASRRAMRVPLSSSSPHTLGGDPRPASPAGGLNHSGMTKQTRGNDMQTGKLILRAQVGFNTSEEPLAVIVLSDTGPGIPQTMLSHLFRPFYTTKPEGEGNGLGLYLVREIIRKNGGKITVSSFEGHGTAFTLEFPLVSAEGLREIFEGRDEGREGT